MKTFTLRLSHSKAKSYHNTETSNEQIIEGILQNSNRVISEVYKQNFLKIKKMVWSFRNTILDPEDIFQEGLTRAIVNIQSGRFRGDSSFATYLNSICRNICLKQLSKKRTSELEQNSELVEEETHFELLNSLLGIKEQLDLNCQKIIDLRFSLDVRNDHENPSKCPSFEEIAELLQLSAANARQRFKRCLDKLRELVSQSSDLNEYFA